MTDKLQTTGSAAIQASNPSDLLRLAVESGADVDKLEKLMALQERWQAGQARKAYDTAMAEFQANMPSVIKTRVVTNKSGQEMYKHANTDDITSAIRKPEHENGFSHRFDFKPIESGGCITTCIVRHAEGHEERTTVTIPSTTGMNTNAAQNRGIEMQYGAKYALCGAYGITLGDEDTDANVPAAQAATVTAPQAKVIRGLLSVIDDGVNIEAKILESWNLEAVENIKASDFDRLIKRLNATLDKQTEVTQ